MSRTATVHAPADANTIKFAVARAKAKYEIPSLLEGYNADPAGDFVDSQLKGSKPFCKALGVQSSELSDALRESCRLTVAAWAPKADEKAVEVAQVQPAE